MADILTYLFIIAVLALVAVAVVWVVRSYANGQSPTAAIFGPRAERRLGIVEQASVDGRRRLLLIRRDGVEHLIMTGGPVDVVIETGIGDVRSRSSNSDAATPVFARPPRSLGQAQPAAAERVADRAAE
ncbi:MAG TPA: hypothetical protein VFV47_13840 [Hyphomicrobiaceae bacterium]|nr:hypothetical protein [Hyphomicrobiaceae bacterium]